MRKRKDLHSQNYAKIRTSSPKITRILGLPFPKLGED